MPEITRELRHPERRWIDESVLDPHAAKTTTAATEAEFARIGSELSALLARQDAVARKLREIVDEARRANG